MRWLFRRDDVKRLEQALLEVARDIWQVETLTRTQHYPSFGSPTVDPEAHELTEQRIHDSFARLQRRWPAHELTTLAADMFFNSRPWYDRYAWDHRRPQEVVWLWPGQGRIILLLLQRWLEQHPPADLVARLRRRIDEILADPTAAPPVPYTQDYRYPPTMTICLALLRGVESPEALALVHDLVRSVATGAPGFVPTITPTDANPVPWEMSYELPRMLQRLWRAALFDQALLEQIFLRFPGLLSQASTPPTGGRPQFMTFYHGLDAEFAAVVRGMLPSIARGWAEHLDDANAPAFRAIRHLVGGWYLLRACEYVEHLKLKDLASDREIVRAIRRMAGAERGDEDEAELVQALRAFRESTLLTVLAVTSAFREIVCRALGWDGAAELVGLIMELGRLGEAGWGVRASPDPTGGVFDRARVEDVHARLGDKRFAALMKTFGTHNSGAKNVLYLIDSAVGRNRQKVLDGFAKRNQLAVRALGLLPIEHPDEVLRRYRALREFAREARSYGMQRQPNERAAAESGLLNLALNAGYADATRLEWAMEDRLGNELGTAGRTWTIDEHYTVALEVDGGTPETVAYKDGKPLRSVPAAVKRHADWEQIKAIAAQMRSQAGRYRAALETAMCRAEKLAPGELATLARNPTGAALLGALLLLDRAGRVGLYRPEDAAIETLDGQRHAVDAPVRVSHCLDLHRLELLAPWQHELVRQRIVQPFKQAFRELYVVTPAEQQTSLFSNRFAGQAVDANRAARLLQSQRWDCTGDEFPRKVFRPEGITAYVTFTDQYHYIGEIGRLEVDQVCFARSTAGSWWRNPDDRMPLDEVPPLLFSEVMRDMDLVVSVAHYTGETGDRFAAAPPAASAEVIARRADLVRSLADDLRLKQVAVDEPYVHIGGKLADYRVHLGSATIHIEPGAYLCVVPDGAGLRRDKLFLPFEEGGNDLKTSEVVSKVLLLADDARIKDESILRQIRAQRAARP